MFDNSLKKEKITSINKDYNLKDKLLNKGKIDKDFLFKLNSLKIEELISLKLDSACMGLNGKLLGFKILKYCQDAAKEAVLHYALSSTNSKRQAALVLGITKTELNRLIKMYQIEL